MTRELSCDPVCFCRGSNYRTVWIPDFSLRLQPVADPPLVEIRLGGKAFGNDRLLEVLRELLIKRPLFAKAQTRGVLGFDNYFLFFFFCPPLTIWAQEISPFLFGVVQRSFATLAIWRRANSGLFGSLMHERKIPSTMSTAECEYDASTHV